MGEAQLRGKIFESLLKFYLKQQGYTVIPQEIQGYYGVSRRSNGLNIRGRGGWHQVDALGQFQFQIPFVYPIRLISEAKSHNQKIGLPTIRDFVGILKDVSENYFIENYNDLTKSRFTDCGAVFSTSEFTKDAQMYAHAQGVYLIQASTFLPLIDRVVNQINNRDTIREIISGDLRNYPVFSNNDFFAYSGIISNVYPVVITSNESLPFQRFSETDEVEIRLSYEADQQHKEVYGFNIRFDSWRGKFQLPRYIWEQYAKRPDFIDAMIKMKLEKLNYIDIPLKIEGKRRIIRLKLDRNWLENLSSRHNRRRRLNP